MALTSSSVHGAVHKAVQGDTIPEKYLKAMFWVLSGATAGTDLCEITEADGDGHPIYVDAAQITDGAWPIPCPDKQVDNFYVKDLDNGYILAYPVGHHGLE